MNDKEELKRTKQQNRAMHLYFTNLAIALNEAGYDAKAVLDPEIEIPITASIVKNQMLKKIIKAMFDKDSTTELSTKELSMACLVLNKHISESFGISVPFPDRFRGE